MAIQVEIKMLGLKFQNIRPSKFKTLQSENIVDIDLLFRELSIGGFFLWTVPFEF